VAQHGLIAATSQPTGVDKSPTIFFSPIESDSRRIHKKIMNGPFFWHDPIHLAPTHGQISNFKHFFI